MMKVSTPSKKQKVAVKAEMASTAKKTTAKRL